MEKQEILTNQVIEKMTKERYANKFSKLQIYETIASIICYGSAIFLILNFEKLDSWYLILFGIITLLLLLVLPVLTLRKIGNMKKLNIAKSSYKDVLVNFQKAKESLFFTQRITLYLSIVLAIIILPVTSKIFKNIDLFEAGHTNNLLIYIPILLIFLFFLSRWVFKGYRSVTNSAENILKEIDS
ncbi:MAG TPA: hypothetical protein VFD78_05200 [Chitinophagaceae bacterium]|nr:hypothetical protein [Chitinophagaceae bacterium]